MACLKFQEQNIKTKSDMFSKKADPLDKHFQLNMKEKEIEMARN